MTRGGNRLTFSRKFFVEDEMVERAFADLRSNRGLILTSTSGPLNR